MDRRHPIRHIVDRSREGCYLVVFVVAIGSVWTAAWANGYSEVPAGGYPPSARHQPSPSQTGLPGTAQAISSAAEVTND